MKLKFIAYYLVIFKIYLYILFDLIEKVLVNWKIKIKKKNIIIISQTK